MYELEFAVRTVKVGVRVPELPAEDGDPRGRLTRLVPVSGQVLLLIKQWDQNRNDPVVLLEIMGHLLPDLTPEDVRQLGTGTMLELLDMAMQSVEALRARASAPPAAPRGRTSTRKAPGA
jgi:hypothetical protein